MEFRSVFISNPAQLSVRKGQLIVRQDMEISIPMEDISSLLIESRAVTITAAALQELADHGVTTYNCDVSHMPAALLLPMNRNCRQLKQLKEQINMTLPTRKRIWAEVVAAKIGNQARCLQLMGIPGYEDLHEMAKSVRPGDPDNLEASAAAVYFPLLFGSGFTRSEDSIRNSCPNYGYAILRGAVARNLAIRGVEPCLGIFHHNELNQFNLADDLMEPYRPLVDLFVASGISDDMQMSPPVKQQLFNLSNYLIFQGKKRYKAISAVGRMTDSFVRILHKQGRDLELPELLPLQEYHYE